MNTPEINDGGPAFPHLQLTEPPEVANAVTVPGMSLRDWFAGQALCGLHAGAEFPASTEDYARCAYEHADAMIAQRNKK